MLNIENKYIGQASYVLHFKNPIQKVRFLQGQFEEAFAGLIGVQSEQTNVPDNFDPNMARIIFSGKNKSIVISQLAIQQNFIFEDSSIGFERQIEIVKKNVLDLHSRAEKLEFVGGYGQNAIILDLNLPSDEHLPVLHGYLYGTLMRPAALDEVASFHSAIGFKVGDLFMNVAATVYEQRRVELSAAAIDSPMIVSDADAKLVEKGVLIKIDINNRPKNVAGRNEGPEQPEDLVKSAVDFMGRSVENFFGVSL